MGRSQWKGLARINWNLREKENEAKKVPCQCRHSLPVFSFIQRNKTQVLTFQNCSGFIFISQPMMPLHQTTNATLIFMDDVTCMQTTANLIVSLCMQTTPNLISLSAISAVRLISRYQGLEALRARSPCQSGNSTAGHITVTRGCHTLYPCVIVDQTM